MPRLGCGRRRLLGSCGLKRSRERGAHGAIHGNPAAPPGGPVAQRDTFTNVLRFHAPMLRFEMEGAMIVDRSWPGHAQIASRAIFIFLIAN